MGRGSDCVLFIDAANNRLASLVKQAERRQTKAAAEFTCGERQKAAAEERNEDAAALTPAVKSSV